MKDEFSDDRKDELVEVMKNFFSECAAKKLTLSETIVVIESIKKVVLHKGERALQEKGRHDEEGKK